MAISGHTLVEELWVELHEQGGMVGRTLRYGAWFAQLSPEAQQVLLELTAVDEARVEPGEGADLLRSRIYLGKQGEGRLLDTAGVDPDELELLLGELRGYPLRCSTR